VCCLLIITWVSRLASIVTDADLKKRFVAHGGETERSGSTTVRKQVAAASGKKQAVDKKA